MRTQFHPIAAVLLLAVLGAVPVEAQPGASDPTFDQLDVGFAQGNGFRGNVRALILQPDNKVLVAGSMNYFQGTACNRITRLNADGTLDAAFSGNNPPGFNGAVNCMVLLPDSSLLIGGAFIGLPGSSTRCVAHLNQDGSLNTDFTTMNIISGTSARALAVQPDGKVIVAGQLSTFLAPNVNIYRLHPNGSVDTTFNAGTGTGAGQPIEAIALQPDGRIIIGGIFNTFNGVPCGHIARLNTDGSLDTTFITGSGFNNTVEVLALRPDGRLLVGGWFSSFAGAPVNNIIQLNADGSVDGTFHVGTGTDGSVHSVLLRVDGSVMVGGAFNAYDGTTRNGLVLLNTDGSVDTGFDPGISVGTSGPVGAIVERADGKLLIGGEFTSFDRVSRGRIAQLHADGTLDHDVFRGTGFDQQPFALAVRPDGRIIVGGDFISFSDTARAGIASLYADGSLDTSFDPGTGFLGRVTCLAVQPDGRVIVGGNLYEYNGATIHRIIRLNTDGSGDGSFDVGSGFDNTITALALQPDGKVIVACPNSYFNGQPTDGIVRLNTDGSRDATFNGIAPSALSLAVQPDGRILVGGSGLRRLMPDGSDDPSFNAGNIDNQVYAIALQSDGKVIAGGNFSQIAGIPRRGIARVLPTGAVDPTYAPTGPDQVVIYALALQQNGYVIGGGAFGHINGISRNDIARWTPSGDLDMDLDPGSGFHNFDQSGIISRVNALAFQPDGSVIAAGDFISYNNIGRNRIVRLLTGCAVGTACDDGMASTINDTYDANCFCTGTSLCLPTQLTTTADPVISCGAVNLKLNGTSTIAATEVPGANKYQFRFTNTAGQPAYARTIAFPTRSFTLTPWYTKPLKAGRTYNVQVHASFDNGATWCDYGPSCTVKISWTPLAPFAEPRGYEAAYTGEPMELLLYPNPTNGEQVRIQLSGIDPELTNATLDITDLFGKRVMSTTLPLNDGALNTSLALPGALADGLYVVTIVTGEQLFTERLMIAR
ncbi:MAG: T9SS type A sorting domain-containing protein [Flavobacteriales bacterium]|nr:T9SS type A sorting domain-containing protein [Flavobacteriales bacterium]